MTRTCLAPSLRVLRRATLAAALVLAATTGCSDGDEDGVTYPDHGALAAWLSDEVGPTDVADIESIYADHACEAADSSFVLVRTLNEPTEGTDTETALHTQVAVDTYLCEPDFAREVIDLTFEGDANTDLNTLIDELEERQRNG